MVIEALSGGEPVTLPLAPGMLHTMHFKVAQDCSPSDDVKQFASIIWECFQILRENYPSRLDLSEDNLSRCAPYFTDLTKTELMRREVSCIASRREDPALVTSEEAAEIWFVLYTAMKMHDARAVLICLQLLADTKHCPGSVFRGVRQSEIGLLEMILEEKGMEGVSWKMEEQCRVLAREVREQCGRDGEMSMISEGDLSQRLSIQSGSYDPPSSIRALIFQLNETVCVERATFLLECLSSTPSCDLSQSHIWLESLSSVLHKYCDGIYGSEEHDVIRYGLFQTALSQCFTVIAVNPEAFISILSMGLLLKLMEIAEEACLLVHRLILEKMEMEGNRLFEYVGSVLSLGELSISAAFYKYLRPLLAGLYKVDSRLLSFIDLGDSRDLPAPTDPEELKALSPHLASIRERVRALITRIEAITDFQESYEEKYSRLFPSPSK